jgi:N-acetylglutamate synthase-like GNAT family acetyltransferase
MHPSAHIRRCHDEERSTILRIVNRAAEAYRHTIPADCWKEPYMPREELDEQIASGVTFWGYQSEQGLSGVMGLQPVRDVDLIRHAYVLPDSQQRGIGGALLKHCCGLSSRRVLVGTWAAATWAVDFYRRHGFTLLPADQSAALLRSYWTISQRQLETSVALVFSGVLT